MADYVYTLSHHVWETDADGNGGFALPVGTVAAVDLRNLTDCGAAGVEKEAVFLAMDPAAVIGSEHHVLGRGDLREMRLSATERSLWASVTGYTPQGDTLNDWLADHLLNGADPLGQAACKPLIPTVGNELEIHLAGHSRVWRQEFRFGVHSHTNRVAAVLQEDFKRQFEDEQAGRAGKDHAAKCLDYWCDKYRIDKRDKAAWQRLVPAKLRKDIAGPVKHSTTITDNFTRADGTTIGNLLTWTETANDSATLSNAVANNGAGANNAARARAESDLSGADHYSQAVLSLGSNTGRGAGVLSRCDSGADTCYRLQVLGGGAGTTKVPSIGKVVTGTLTVLFTGSAVDWTDGTSVGKMESSGSTQTGYKNGASIVSGTDTAISGGTRCGIFTLARTSADPPRVDTFEAADLAVGGQPTMARFGGIPYAASLTPRCCEGVQVY